MAASLVLVAAACTTTSGVKVTTSARLIGGGGSLSADPAVNTFTLDNGLTVHIRENNRPGLNAEMRLVVNAGSGVETDDQSGVAHFLEHMLFNGTEKYPNNSLLDQLRRFGMEFGADINAYTSYDETVYQLSVPLEDPDSLEVGIDILGEWLDAATIDPDQVISERGVVLDEERQRGESLQGRAFDVLESMYLDGSGYEGRSPIGELDALENMTAAPLREYYDTWYRPDNAAVIVVGDFDADEAETLVRRRFEQITADGPSPSRPELAVPAPTDVRAAVLADPDALTADVEIAFPVPRNQVRDETALSTSLQLTLAFDMIANRFVDDVRNGDAEYVESFVSDNNFVRNLVAPSLYIYGEPDQLDEQLEALVVEVERVRQHGFDENELARVVASHRSDLSDAFEGRDTVQDRDYAADLVDNFLKGDPIPKIDDWVAFVTAVLDDVTVDSVAATFVARMDASAPHVFASFPDDSTETTTVDDITALVADVGTRQLDARPPSAPLADELMSRPAPVMEDDSTLILDHPNEYLVSTQLTFPNGARVVLTPTEIIDNEVSVLAISPGGMSLVDPADVPAALLASDVVTTSGLGSLSQTEVDAITDRTQIDVSISVEATEEVMYGTAATGDLEILLQLVHQLFAEPQFEESALAEVVRSYAPIAADPMSNPDWAPYLALLDTQFGGDPRFAALPTEAELDEMTIGDIEKVWTERFGDPADWTIVLTGDFDLDEVTDLSRRYVGDLTGNGTSERAAVNRPPFPPGITTQTVAAGTGDRGSVIHLFNVAADVSDEEFVLVDLLTSVLETRLTDHIREELGASYSPYATISTVFGPDSFIETYIEVTGNPDGIPELAEILIADLADLATDRPTIVEFETAVAATERFYNGFSNPQLSFVIANDALYPGSIDSYLARVETLRDLDINDLAEFAARVMPPDQFIQILNVPA